MKSVLITSSILILLIAALRPLLRGKIDPRLQYALWLAAALRLFTPVALADSAYSALALLSRVEEPAQIVETIGQTTVPIPAMSYEDAYDQALREYHQDRPVTTSFTDLAEVELRARELQAKDPTLAELAAKYAHPVWLGGAALMGLWFLLVNLRLRRRLKRAKRLEGVDCPLPVYVTDLPSPCLCGTVRPAIYVTPAAVESPDRLRHVLVHELTHYRHRDHWWALLRCLCLCLYWFDPLVWWAAALSRQDCELACDEGAIRRLGEGERLPYGRTLVAMIAAGRSSLLNTATTMTGSKSRVKERIRLIARRPKTVFAVTLALMVFLACAVGCTFTGVPEGSPEPAGTQDPEPLSSEELTADTLVARLLDVPEELRDNVEARPHDGTLAVYYFKHPGEAVDEAQYLLIVSERSEEDLQRLYAEHYSAGGSHWFAKRGSSYYVFERNTSIEYDLEDEEQFNAAFRAIQEFAKYMVLDTVGVEPFDLDSFQPEDGPSPEQQAIQAAMDAIINAPDTGLVLQEAETNLYIYQTESSPSDYWVYRLDTFATDFEWTELTTLPDGALEGGYLMIQPGDSLSCVWAYKDSNIVAIRTPENRMAYFAGKYVYSYGGDHVPYDSLRAWFDEVELTTLRTTSVPDRGQSHEDVVKEWIEGYEGALTKCAPGGSFTCTYVRAQDMKADAHSFMSKEDIDGFAESRGHSGDDYGKTWFTFTYRLVFVPENENAKNYLMAGNTEDYTGDDAPEGAQICSRVGYMELTDGNWTCEGTDTGW